MMRRHLAVLMLVAALALPACTPRSEQRGDEDRVAWTWFAPAGARVGVPAADERGVAVVSGQHELVMLDDDGIEQWRAPHLGLRRLAPVMFDDVVVASADDDVAAFDRRTGSHRWTVPVLAVRSVPTLANAPTKAGDHTVVATTTGGSTVAIDVASGLARWTSPPLPGQVLDSAAVGENAVAVTWEPRFVGDVSGVAVYDLDDGTERWRSELAFGPTGAPAIIRDEVVVVTADQRIEAFALDDGRARWSLRTPGAGAPAAAPVGRADDVLVVDRLGVISAVRAGRLLWRHDTGGAIDLAPPVSGVGRVIVALAGGEVVGVTARRATKVSVPTGIVGAALRPDNDLVVAFETASAAGVRRIRDGRR